MFRWFAFDDGSEHSLYLDGSPTDHINPDLSSGADLTTAIALSENSSLAFQGVTPIGPFKISSDLGKSFLRAPLNPNGLPNSNVVRPCLDADDIASRGGNGYIIDFGTDMAESDAALYELPLEYVKTSREAGKGESSLWGCRSLGGFTSGPGLRCAKLLPG